MTNPYLLCSKSDHYVKSHRGESLGVGSLCPVANCVGKLRPAPEAEDVAKCPGCSKGLLLPVEVDGRNVELCSYCGQSRLVRSSEDVPAPKSGAQRVAACRARQRAATN